MVWFSKEDGFRAERVGSAILKLSIPNANAGLLSQELNDFTQRLKVFETAAKLLSVNVEFGSPREEIQGHGKPRWTRSLTVQLPSDEVKAKEYVELIKKHFGFDFSDLLPKEAAVGGVDVGAAERRVAEMLQAAEARAAALVADAQQQTAEMVAAAKAWVEGVEKKAEQVRAATAKELASAQGIKAAVQQAAAKALSEIAEAVRGGKQSLRDVASDAIRRVEDEVDAALADLYAEPDVEEPVQEPRVVGEEGVDYGDALKDLLARQGAAVQKAQEKSMWKEYPDNDTGPGDAMQQDGGGGVGR